MWRSSSPSPYWLPAAPLASIPSLFQDPGFRQAGAEAGQHSLPAGLPTLPSPFSLLSRQVAAMDRGTWCPGDAPSGGCGWWATSHTELKGQVLVDGARLQDCTRGSHFTQPSDAHMCLQTEKHTCARAHTCSSSQPKSGPHLPHLPVAWREVSRAPSTQAMEAHCEVMQSGPPLLFSPGRTNLSRYNNPLGPGQNDASAIKASIIASN